MLKKIVLIGAMVLCAPSMVQAKPTTIYQHTKKIEPPKWRATTFKARAGQQALLFGRIMTLLKMPEAATLSYLAAAEMLPQLRDFLHIKAAEHALNTNPHLVTRYILSQSDALDKPIKGAGLVQAQFKAKLNPTTPLDAKTIKQAITHSPTTSACHWVENHIKLAQAKTPAAINIAQKKNARSVINLIHGRCLGAKYQSPAKHMAAFLSPQARLERAHLLYRKVRFYFSKAQLDQVNPTQLNQADRCNYHFRMARTLYRIRKFRKDSTGHYLKVAAQCKKYPALRKKSLYGAGKYLYAIKKNDDAQRAYTQLLKDYPKSRYADDAYYYLARIARRNKKTALANTLLQQALKNTPDGDMIFEMVWEQHESKLEAKQYRAFIKTINQLKLPKQDDNYFSQGRLTYFVGWSYEQLKQPKQAQRAYKKVFLQYPFSFYGYLSWAKLKVKGKAPAFAKSHNNIETWFPTSWQTSPQALLYHSGLKQWAAQLERIKQPKNPTKAELWRLAFLYDRAGVPATSHNIARRRIQGRPWNTPKQNRNLRWSIAWPNPFGDVMHKAHKAEQKQHKVERVLQALPLAIMREESSFIPTIESYAGALGLMQLMPATALNHDKDIKGRATPTQLKKPEINIRVGVDHIFLLANRLKQHPVLMVAAYNAGAGAVRRWLKKSTTTDIARFVEFIPSFQTRNYTKRVIGSYFAYQWLLQQKKMDTRILGSATLPKKK